MSMEMKKVAVVIETKSLRIRGQVAVPAVSRLSDYANDPQRRFWAVTEAEISPLAVPARRRVSAFILVASHEICVISPDEPEPSPAVEAAAERAAETLTTAAALRS